MNIQKAREELLEVKSILDGMGLPFWLKEGTLLAAVRDRDFFPWDHDMDIAMKAADIPPDFGAHFPGYECTEARYRLGLVTNIVLKKTVRIDVMLLFHNPELESYVILSPPYVWNLGRTMYPERWVDTPQYIEFLGESFRIPLHSECMLISEYGPDWMKPVKSGLYWRKYWAFIEHVSDITRGIEWK